MSQVTKTPWRIVHCDAVEEIRRLKTGAIHLACYDPPYNIGRDGYEDYDDKLPRDVYMDWARSWMSETYRVLHRHGSFWCFIGDELVSELDVLAKELGFHKRGHIIWAFTFGVNCPKKFTRAHTHILYYTKTKSKFTFNKDDSELRVPSARQLIYKDKRANPKGRLPDDVWILRPNEMAEIFNGDSDVWLQSRICGTFKERIKGSDNQLPIELLKRIIRTSSNQGDMVLDIFSGTGTTIAAANELGRKALGFEQSARDVKRIQQRMKERR